MQPVHVFIILLWVGFSPACALKGFRSDPVGIWAQTSPDRSCAVNNERISKIDTRHEETVDACRISCERHGTCIAVDFYWKNSTCDLYDAACVTPLAVTDDASSFRMVRKPKWKVISKSAACQENKEGFEPFDEQEDVASLQECKNLCAQRARCKAVDYFDHLEVCSFYEEACETPQTIRNDAASYRIVAQTQALTVKEQKREMVEQAKQKSAWSMIKEDAGCEENDEGIKPLSRQKEYSLFACQKRCQQDPRCTAVDFSVGSKGGGDSLKAARSYCTLFAQPCLMPKKIGGASSWQLNTAPLEWGVISRARACQDNDEGIVALDAGVKEDVVPGPANLGATGPLRLESPEKRTRMRLSDCKKACEVEPSCVAIDFFYSSSTCTLYPSACVVPKSTHDGASSHQIIRMPQKTETTQVKENSGFSVSAEKVDRSFRFAL